MVSSYLYIFLVIFIGDQDSQSHTLPLVSSGISLSRPFLSIPNPFVCFPCSVLIIWDLYLHYLMASSTAFFHASMTVLEWPSQIRRCNFINLFVRSFDISFFKLFYFSNFFLHFIYCFVYFHLTCVVL